MERANTFTLYIAAIGLATASVAAQITGALNPGQVERAEHAGVDQAVAIEMPIDILALQAYETGDVLTAKPFQADVLTESIQALSDGNRIVRRGIGRMFRDSQGRTRREQDITGLAPITSASAARYVLITDPVDGVSVVVDEQAKHAVRAPLIGVSPAPAVAPTSAGTDAAHGAARRTPRLSVQTRDLGEKVVNGVHAVGTRTIATLPPGAVGNELPLVITAERWTARELNVLVSTRTHDPRFGETRYDLSNIRLTEPAPTLFVVPPGYAVNASGVGRR